MADVAGAGFDAHVVRKLSHLKKKGRKSRWRYTWCLVRNFFRYKSTGVKVWVDGRLVYNNLLLSAAVGICKFNGGGLQQLPDEKNDQVSVEFVINDDFSLENGAINPSYTTGQKMYKAVMNTIIGMGTVFIVLIFISFIIGLFKYISVWENKNKAKNNASADAQGVNNAIAQIVSNEEQDEEVDDLELVAVITAAIAASENTSTDGLVVRSIRKVNSRRK